MRKFFNIPDRIKVIIVSAVLSIGVIFYISYKLNRIIRLPNVKSTQYIYVSTGSKFRDLVDNLKKNDALFSYKYFIWLAEKKNLVNHIYPGKYQIKQGMNNNQLINLFRKGCTVPVELSFNNTRTKKQLADLLASQLEFDSLKFMELLNDSATLSKYGFSRQNVLVMFIPNTYQFNWNTSPKQFFDKMYRVYKHFWNEERLQKANKLNLSVPDVIILASIVQLETKKIDEASLIAGVNLNRLNRGIMLQSDPTVIYAIGDFNIRRLLNYQLQIDSPYNTYKYKGLPPGPICLPNPAVIDKVLDSQQNDYLFFCAKEDLSGYHTFAKTAKEHMINAAKYQNALNKLNIKN